ncbi:MAG TPA: chemotaxis protein CheA [Thiotrichaceae bacterium]|nr:chemotaxis protein CheA [Thiotrichaceae bacterium]
MPVDLTEVRKLFFEESFENLDVMESSLLDLEVETIDQELINCIFRAAHSIKGGAGIFKFDHVTDFAHAAETLLDEMRNEEHLITQSLIDLLLRSVDVLRMMLSALQEAGTYDFQEAQACQKELQKALKNQNESEADKTSQFISPIEARRFVTDKIQLENTEQSLATNQGWKILFKPDLSMLKTGNDPINLFRELDQLGNLDVKVDTSQLPALEDLEPQLCYLSWELILHGDVERAEIDEIFEWVEDECELQITSLGAPSEPVEVSPIVPTLPDAGETALFEQAEVSSKSETVVQETVDESALEEAEAPTFNKPEAEKESVCETETRVEAVVETEASEGVSESDTELEVSDRQAVVETAVSVDEKATSAPDISALIKTPEVHKGAAEAVSHHATEASSNSIRVNIDKIDSLINMVGELVITQSMLDQIGEHFDSSRITHLRDGLAQLERNSRELQENVMRIRMLPISYSFNRFPRLVHDLSAKLGKKIELKLSGEQTELDKTVLEKMSDPLVHLVRNALDHGIEIPELRRAAGKSETGELHLHAFHQGGNIVIQINDDGAGFDLDKIRAKAIEKGFLNLEDHPSQEQLYDLIFQPGFSTASQVSNVSGRGVGMDVVRRNIRALGGSIEVKSQRGKGSTFTIRLPLTLAILDGQLVRVGDEIYILSLLSIIESLRIKRNLVNSFAGFAEVYRLRDEYIPILRLYDLFGITPTSTQLEHGLLVIVEGDGQKMGLFVDELLSQQQIVIKSLESNYKKVEGLSGATILGDGSVALILDVAGLIHLFQSQIKAPHTRFHFLSGVRYER